MKSHRAMIHQDKELVIQCPIGTIDLFTYVKRVCISKHIMSETQKKLRYLLNNVGKSLLDVDVSMYCVIIWNYA